MPTFRVLIAEKTIEVSSIYDEVRELCCDYMTDGEPDFKVQIVPEDLTLERERSIKSAKAEGRESYNSSDSWLSTERSAKKCRFTILFCFMVHVLR